MWNLFANTDAKVTRAYYTHLTYRMITMTRGILVSAIFKKTLSLDSSHTKNSAAVTLMSTDIDGIARGLAVVHDIWASLVELGLGIYILVTVVGKAAFLVVMPTLGKFRFQKTRGGLWSGCLLESSYDRGFG